MANFNKVILMGNLTRDPQLRYLPSNTAVCDLGLAINRRYRGQDGQLKDETCFVDVTAFGKQAETLNEYMKKGRPILIEGRLNYRQWTTEDGQKRSKLSVVAEQFQFVGSREGGGGGRGEGGGPGPGRGTTGRGGEDEAPPPEFDEAPAGGDDIPF